jgi:uncharacterized protein YcbK (DUF882 family)
LLAGSSGSLQNLIANGDTRTLSFHHIHTEEDLTVTFKKNWFLRDWRRDEETKLDPHLFDVLWEVQREVGAKEAIHIVSAFRSPQTNSMLRRRGRGVARYSLHMVGKAIDFYIPGAELSDLRVAGLRLQRGGVGFYPTSGSPFVHLDTGNIRHWPRMTRDQLARVFPDGKTVHLPSDGRPMARYELAAAELARKGRSERIILASNEEDEDAPRPSARSRMPTVAPRATDSEVKPATPRPMVASLGSTGLPAEAVPLPRPRPFEMANLQPDRREITGSLPQIITGARDDGLASPTLAYAPTAGVLTDDAVMPPATPAPRATRPVVASQDVPNADAAQAPGSLLTASMVQYAADLSHPDLASWRSLVAPARAAVATRFGNDLADAPVTARFSGPAVVRLRVVAFDRGAGILTGVLAWR